MLKKYNEFVSKSMNEGLRSKLKANSAENIKHNLSQMDVADWIKEVRTLKLDDSYLPSDDEINEWLDKEEMEDKLYCIKNYQLYKFLPSNEELKEWLEDLDMEDWIGNVDYYNLDKSLLPTNEDVIRYKLPSEIEIVDGKYEFENWEDWIDLIEYNREEFVRSVLNQESDAFHCDSGYDGYCDFNDEQFQEIKADIKSKLDELDVDEEVLAEFEESDGMDSLYNSIKYDVDEVKSAIDDAWNQCQCDGMCAECFEVITDEIIDMFCEGGKDALVHEDGYFCMPCKFPEMEIDGKIKWSEPSYSIYSNFDLFTQELSYYLHEN